MLPNRLTVTFLFAATAVASIVATDARAQSADPPKYEFRAAWIATVLRLDWPPNGQESVKQERLVEMIDELASMGINAIFFQVRSEADAMYPSDHEPWSYWLTSTQGEAPDPAWDPLQFAIEHAHKRGVELHAWLNPYRAVRGSGYTNSADHVSQLHPDWMLTFGSLQTFDPGLPETREHIIKVIADIATRYDIDGVHFDDYFYPYPPNQISNQDDQTFQDHSRGFTDRGDWRRDNVDLLIEALHDTLGAIDPAIKFGISPFGIWKNGVPSGIVGLDAYNVIFGDATAWLESQTVDYLTPQLYWPFGGGQDYAKLATWWAEQTSASGRHLYPGHGLYRSDGATFSGTLFSATEIPNQVRYNRANESISGSVFFRAKNLTVYSSKGFSDSLRTDLYRYPALQPIMDWKDMSPPGAPGDLAWDWGDDGDVVLTWNPTSKSKTGEVQDGAMRYAVYRVLSGEEPDPDSVITESKHLIGVTGENTFVDTPEIADATYYYHVRSVSRNSVESEASNVVALGGPALATEIEGLPTFELRGNYPNPFTNSTTIEYSLARPARVSLTVYDALGRVVARPVIDGAAYPGIHRVVWDGATLDGRAARSGSYFYVLEVEGRRETRPLVLLR